MTANNNSVSGRDGFVLGQAIGLFIYNDVATPELSWTSSDCIDLIAVSLHHVHPSAIANGLADAARRAAAFDRPTKSFAEILGGLSKLREGLVERYPGMFADEILNKIFDPKRLMKGFGFSDNELTELRILCRSERAAKAAKAAA